VKVPKYIQYAQDVIEGRVVTGELVRLACERFFRFMEDERYEFRHEAVERVVKFFGLLKHYTGRHAGKPFVLEPWQIFCVAQVRR
jgi:phage terminase large subunit-like protein